MELKHSKSKQLLVKEKFINLDKNINITQKLERILEDSFDYSIL
jgi:hypothetical protein